MFSSLSLHKHRNFFDIIASLKKQDASFWFRRWARTLAAAFFVLLVLTSFYVLSLQAPTSPSGSSAIHKLLPSFSSTSRKATDDVFNATLGFGAILLISLPERTDRRDAVSLIASAQGVQITKLINAVKGSEVAAKAKPAGSGKQKLKDGEIGAWRSHIDAFKWIVDNGIETALILEDDIDWDIYVKEQLHAFALGLRASNIRPTPWTSDESARAPYGLDWDVLHLGPAMIHPAPPPFSSVGFQYPDPHRNPKDCVGKPIYEWYCFSKVLGETKTPSTHRAIVPSYRSVGLVALAITNMGAKRLIYEESWRGLEKGIDWSINESFEKGSIRGWTAAPPIMSSWKVGGPGDSDLRNTIALGDEKTNLHDGHAPGLLFSSRASLTSTLARDDVYWVDGRFSMASGGEVQAVDAEPNATENDASVDGADVQTQATGPSKVMTS